MPGLLLLILQTMSSYYTSLFRHGRRLLVDPQLKGMSQAGMLETASQLLNTTRMRRRPFPRHDQRIM